MAGRSSGPSGFPPLDWRNRFAAPYEETQDDDPFKISNPQARFLTNMPRLGLSKYKTDLQKFYNHAFAILDVAPDKITATYYEYPSWGEASAPPSDPVIDKFLYQEHLVPMR